MSLPLTLGDWPGSFPSFATPRYGQITIHPDIITIASRNSMPDWNGTPGMIFDNRTGKLVCVYRVADGHMPNTPGIIVMVTSDDFGATWSSPTTIVGDGILDVRDPELTLLSDGTYIMPYFDHNGGSDNDSIHTWVIKSADFGETWSVPVQVNGGWTSWTACSGPIIEIPGGDLIFAVYGRDTGDMWDSTRVLRSSDKGNSWGGTVEVGNGPATLQHFNEPNIGVSPNGDLMILIRGSSQILRSTSFDNGHTWSTPSIVFAGSGRPTWRALRSGGIIVTYRHGVDNDAAIRTSWDDGVSWTPPTIFDYPGLQYAYASMFEVTPGAIALTYTSEDSMGSADLLFRYLLDGEEITDLRGTSGTAPRSGRKLLFASG